MRYKKGEITKKIAERFRKAMERSAYSKTGMAMEWKVEKEQMNKYLRGETSIIGERFYQLYSKGFNILYIITGEKSAPSHRFNWILQELTDEEYRLFMADMAEFIKRKALYDDEK